MVGIFLNEKELYDLKKSEERTNAIQRREDKEHYHVYAVVCGCPDPECGGWHVIDESRKLPTTAECAEILKKHNKTKKIKRRINSSDR